MKLQNLRILAIPFAAAVCLALAGCDSGGGPDPKTEQVRMDKAVKMRALFDKAGGDYTKLDATDKADWEKMAGANPEQIWNEMKQGPSAKASGPPGQ